VVGFPRDEIVPPTLKVVAGAKFEIPTLFPVNTVKDVPELFARTITFDPRVLGPIVAPVKTPRVPVVAYGTVNVSVANDAFPLTVNELVGFAVPIPTHAFELITTTFDPFENTATFVPTLPYGPTERFDFASTELDVIVFETKRFAVLEN